MMLTKTVQVIDQETGEGANKMTASPTELSRMLAIAHPRRA